MVAKSILLLAVASLAQARAMPQRNSNTPAGNTASATVVYDGRVKQAATKADFDTATGPFGKDDVKGQSQCFILPPHIYLLANREQT